MSLVIKFWETDEDRDQGLSEIYKSYDNITSEIINEAISKAKRIMHLMDYACIEVQDEDNELTYFYSDGVEEEYLDKFKEVDLDNDPGFKEYVRTLLKDGAIDDTKYVNSLSEEEFEDLLTNTWMKDPEIIDTYKSLNESKELCIESDSYWNWWEEDIDVVYYFRNKYRSEVADLINIARERYPQFITDDMDDDYVANKIMGTIWKVDKDTRLYDYLLKWYDGSKEKMLDSMTCGYESPKSVFFTYIRPDEPNNGIGDDYIACNMLGGKYRDGTEKRFIEFIKKQEDELLEESQVRDAINNMINDSRLSNQDYENSFRLMLADKIANIAEELGDDYSEWLGENEVEEIIDDILNSTEWTEFNNILDRLIQLFVEDKVDYIRKDEPASKYYEPDVELDENKELAEGYDSTYRGNDFQELADMYSDAHITKEELAYELLQLYTDKEAARKAYEEVTGESELPKLEEGYTQASNAGAIKVDIMRQPTKKKNKKDKEDKIIKDLPAQQVIIESKANEQYKIYTYELGILLDKSNPEYDYYSNVWDRNYGYYDETIGALVDFDEAKKEVIDYVKNGVKNTYGIICERHVDETVYNEIKNGEDYDDYSYDIEDVVYSIYKNNEGNIIENFLKDTLAKTEESKDNNSKYTELEEAIAKDIYRWLIDNYELDLKDPVDQKYDLESYIDEFTSQRLINYNEENDTSLIWYYKIDINQHYGIKITIEEQ